MFPVLPDREDPEPIGKPFPLGSLRPFLMSLLIGGDTEADPCSLRVGELFPPAYIQLLTLLWAGWLGD